jgi:hypothetical protein
MVHTRENKELRLRIGCLDHTLIWETTDVFIQRGFFKLSFEVEPVIVIQLDGFDMVNNGDNNDGGGNDGSNSIEKDREGAPFEVDFALGSERILSAAAAGAAGPALPLGSQSTCGAASPPVEASPRARRAGSPLSPLCHLPRSATGAAAAAVGSMPPAGAT